MIKQGSLKARKLGSQEAWRLRKPLVAAALLAALAAASFGVRANTRAVQPEADTPVVVELFTSEGCSSCPPADRLLIDLTDKQPIKGALVIGISEHVDYWDHQGWKDPFSDRLFTERQSVYSRAAGSNDIYTPQIIVDGVAALVGHDRAAVFDAIRRAAGRRKQPVAVEWSPEASKASVTVEKSPETAGATVFLAVTEDGLRTPVARGENAGRTLDHAAVARRFTQIGKTDSAGGFTAVIPVTLAPGWHRPKIKIVVFVQVDKSRRVVAAAAVGA
jgi:hypothetical protein